MSKFVQKLEAQWEQGKFVCVGLDPHPEQMPQDLFKMHKAMSFEGLYEFCRLIVEATGDVVLAFKPNIAFFERFGPKGLKSLKRVCALIREKYPGVVLILDYKRGDIDGTNVGYIDLAFNELDADAVTINPYLGQQACQPFLDQTDRGIIVLCKTSNEGAGEFQDLLTVPPGFFDQPSESVRKWYEENWETFALPLYQRVASNVSTDWNTNGNCGLVVGATYPKDLARVRALVGTMPILIPGIGAQGGDLEATIEAGMDSRGWGIIVNSSRGIIHASRENNFAEVARAKTIELNTDINAIRRDALAERAFKMIP